MPNKHFCQGPNCHTYPTTDRFLKSKGIIRGRYAYAKLDDTQKNNVNRVAALVKNKFVQVPVTNNDSLKQYLVPNSFSIILS